MSKMVLNKHLLALLLVTTLVACVTESETLSATGRAKPMGLVTQERSIDWDRAGEDASQGGAEINRRNADTALTVPLLLPPTAMSISRAAGQLTFAEPKILSDAKGYSAVIASDNFDMLIDASNQMMLTDGAAASEFPQDFDGDFQFIEMGSQLTIGRYGALYAIQFICTDDKTGICVDELTAREIVQSLQVQLP